MTFPRPDLSARAQTIDEADLELKLLLCRAVKVNETLADANPNRGVVAETKVHAGSGRVAELRVGCTARLRDANIGCAVYCRKPLGTDEELPVEAERAPMFNHARTCHERIDIHR